MFRSASKKTALLFLAAFYLAALILGTVCSFDPSTSITHHHHQGRTVSHTASCLLACASTLADHPQTLPLTVSLLFIGMLLALGRPFSAQPPLLRLQSRSPPRQIALTVRERPVFISGPLSP